MIILGIDTANRSASVALIDDDDIVAQQIHDSHGVPGSQGGAIARHGNHAEILIPLIEAIFSESKFSFDDLSGIAVSIGPGSFTGLRIGLATVKGLAYENGLPIVGISTLQATALRTNESAGIIAALLDARKSEIYLALFRRNATGLDRLTEDRVTSLKNAIETLRDFQTDRATQMLLAGDGAAVYAESLRQSLGSSVRMANDRGLDTVAACVARLGALRIKERSGDEPGALTPLYLRLAEAESKLEKFA